MKRICGPHVAAHIFDIGSPCVQIRTLGRSNDFSHSLLVNLSDAVATVKAKFESIIGCRSWTAFYFAGRQLPEHLSLVQCGIKPHDTIDMTFDDFGMQIFVKTLTGRTLTICADSSAYSIACFKTKIWLVFHD
jgi:hypothetical protein